MTYAHGTIIYLQVLARSFRASKVYEAALCQSHEPTLVKVFRNLHLYVSKEILKFYPVDWPDISVSPLKKLLSI